MLSNGARHSRSARAHDHGSRRRRVIRIVVPVVRLMLLVGLASAVWHVFPTTGHESRVAESENAPPETPRPIRTEYPLSLVPGGIASDADFETARASDPVLAEHYADVGFLRQVRFSQDQWLYASFRQNDSVVWTNSRILVRAGELVFADRYGSLVRGRCGNRLSPTPRVPAAFADPPEVVSETPEIAFAPPPLPDGSTADYDTAPLAAFAPMEPPPAQVPAGTRIVTTATLPKEWPADNTFSAAAIFGIFAPPGPVAKPALSRTTTAPEPGTLLLTLAAVFLMAAAAILRRRSRRPGARFSSQPGLR